MSNEFKYIYNIFYIFYIFIYIYIGKLEIIRRFIYKEKYFYKYINFESPCSLSPVYKFTTINTVYNGLFPYNGKNIPLNVITTVYNCFNYSYFLWSTR